MQQVVIVAATRTPIGSFQGALATLSAVDLGTVVVKALLARSGVPADQVDEVILGQVLTAGCGQNPARQTALNAGLPYSVP
ncbi:MAG: acetyl-CoA C-acetyltransferase, partial [Serratia proteamaculans]